MSYGNPIISTPSLLMGEGAGGWGLAVLKRSKPFLLLMLADFLARSAYQMGKTPLLPVFAAALGASGAFLGLIVSVSTVTGLFLKPLFGILSDRWGRRAWLLIGTAFFAGMPFLYRFIHSPEQLLLIRLAHGLATAIYGPVTLAYVAELSRGGRVAEDIGWFELARSGGYIAGPALAGWLLLSLEPAAVFTVIGLISCVVFLPVLLLPETRPKEKRKRKPVLKYVVAAIRDGGRTPAVWLTGGLEAGTFIALYTLKAFLPIYALEAGLSIALVGLYFSLGEAAQALGKPFCGRLGDRLGYRPTISLGLLLLAAALLLVSALPSGLLFLLPALLTGLGQALIFPAAKAMVARGISVKHLGAGMGLIGMLQNLGKVAGPVLGGFTIAALGYAGALLALSVLLCIGAVMVWQLFAPGARMRQLTAAR